MGRLALPGMIPLGQKGGHHQPQGAPIPSGGPPSLKPLDQGGSLVRIGLRNAKSGEVGQGIVEAGFPLTEPVEPGIEGG